MTRHVKPDSTTSGGAANTPPISRAEALAAYQASGYDLDTHPAHMIRRAHQRATFYFQQVMSGQDLTPTQHAALATLLKHGELSQNHLGRLTAMDPSTISIVVRKLLKNGLIERHGSEEGSEAGDYQADRSGHMLFGRPSRRQPGGGAARAGTADTGRAGRRWSRCCTGSATATTISPDDRPGRSTKRIAAWLMTHWPMTASRAGL